MANMKIASQLDHVSEKIRVKIRHFKTNFFLVNLSAFILKPVVFISIFYIFH